jgi:hypothetical protein
MADDMVAFIDSHLAYEEGMASRSDFVQHWTRIGKRVMEDPELLEALEWALDRPVQATLTLAEYGPVTVTQEMLDRTGPKQSDLEAEALRYEPPTLDLDAETVTVPEGAVVVLNEEGGKVIVPEVGPSIASQLPPGTAFELSPEDVESMKNGVQPWFDRPTDPQSNLPLDEVETIHKAQLDAMRNRLR